MGTITNIALVIAAAAIVPSAGPFTPAVLFSTVAAFIAAFAIACGHIRRGSLTIYLATSAAVVSPIFTDLQRVDVWLVVLSAIGGVAGVVLYLDYHRRCSSLSR